MARLSRTMNNIGGTAGDLNKLVQTLVDAFGPEEAAKISRSPQFGQMLQAVATPKGGGLAGLGLAVGAELLAQPISRGLGSILQSGAGAISPTSYQAAGMSGSSKYFVQPEAIAGYTQWYQNEIPKIRLWNSTIGAVTGQRLQEPMTPEEYRKQAIEGAEFQAQTYNQRLIEQERAKAEAEYAMRALEAGYGLEAEKVKTLGDVQRQRISSGYSAAGSALNSAIENILATSKLENSPVLSEVGKAF
jgi:hypothetical protein